MPCKFNIREANCSCRSHGPALARPTTLNQLADAHLFSQARFLLPPLPDFHTNRQSGRTTLVVVPEFAATLESRAECGTNGRRRAAAERAHELSTKEACCQSEAPACKRLATDQRATSSCLASSETSWRYRRGHCRVLRRCQRRQGQTIVPEAATTPSTATTPHEQLRGIRHVHAAAEDQDPASVAPRRLISYARA
jgi:hypothetical protein